MQKYRFDVVGEAMPDGSVPVYSKWMAGRTLAGVRNCICPDGNRRTVYIRGEADTYFSIPAACKIAGKYTSGWIGCSDRGYEFHAAGFLSGDTLRDIEAIRKAEIYPFGKGADWRIERMEHRAFLGVSYLDPNRPSNAGRRYE